MKKILRYFFGKTSLQPIFEVLHRIALQGMNYSNGSGIKISGELNAMQYVKQRILEGKNKYIIIFDVGANIGEYSLALINNFPPHTSIYAFEPSKSTFAILKNNVSHLSKIIQNNIGMSDNNSQLILYSNNPGSGLASVYKRNLKHFDIELNQLETIDLTTIDDYCSKNNIETIDLLKLDIEGHEYKALTGASKMLTDDKIHFIQFEMGGTNIDSRTYFSDFFYLLHDKYKIYRILKDGLFEIKKYNERYEIFTAVNYLAENKKFLPVNNINKR